MNKLTALLLLLLLAPAAVMAQKTDQEIVKVNGTSIKRLELLERLLSRFGQGTIEQMIDELLLRQEAESRKIGPDKKEVEKRMEAMRSQFPNEATFQNHLSNSGVSEEKLREDVGHQIMVEELVVKIKKLSVKEKDIREAFEKNKARLGEPPAVHLRHIQVKTEQEAKKILSELEAGADFKELAKQKSVAPTGKLAGGDYGFVPRGYLPPEIDEVVFEMKLGETKHHQSAIGHHVLQVLAKRDGKAPEYKKVKEGLERMLLTEKIQDALPTYVRELRKKADIQFIGKPK